LLEAAAELGEAAAKKRCKRWSHTAAVERPKSREVSAQLVLRVCGGSSRQARERHPLLACVYLCLLCNNCHCLHRSTQRPLRRPPSA
jgi:hypothetical protein